MNMSKEATREYTAVGYRGHGYRGQISTLNIVLAAVRVEVVGFVVWRDLCGGICGTGGITFFTGGRNAG